MEDFRDNLAAAIGDGDQAQARAVIKEWSAVVSNVDVSVMREAKAIVRQAREATLGLDEQAGDFELFPEDEEDPYFDEEDESTALQTYFSDLQSVPTSAASFAGSAQSQVPEDMSGDTTVGEFDEFPRDPDEIGEFPPYIPAFSLETFREISIDNKRHYLTLIAELIPNGALQDLFMEVFDEGNDRVAAAFEVVYPGDERASGGDEEDLEIVYEAMLRSEVLRLVVNEPIIDEPDEIASLPSSLRSVVSSILGGEDEPLDPLLSREEFQKRSAEKGLSIDLGVIEETPELDISNLDLTPIAALAGDRTPVRRYNPEQEAKYEFARAQERGPQPVSAYQAQRAKEQQLYGGPNPYKFATEADFAPGGKFSGNGIMGCGKCSGRGMSCCDRCYRDGKKMKAGKLPIGKGKNIIIGRGIGTNRVTARVVPSNINLSAGIKAEPAYVSFGKHLINKHRLLKDDVLMLRTMKGGAITSVPTQKISRSLSKVLKTIIGGGSPDYESLNVLTDGDKEVLYNISKTSRISNSVPNPNKSKQEQEDSRFELLKGQIASGQYNKDAIKEFKLLLIKMMNSKRIPKGQGIDILTEMAALGL